MQLAPGGKSPPKRQKNSQRLAHGVTVAWVRGVSEGSSGHIVSVVNIKEDGSGN